MDMSTEEFVIDVTIAIWGNFIPSAFIGFGYYLFHKDLITSTSIILVGGISSIFKDSLMRLNVTRGICRQIKDESTPILMTSFAVSSSAAMIFHLNHNYLNQLQIARSAPLICLSAIVLSLFGVWCIGQMNQYRTNGRAIPADAGFIVTNIFGAVVAATLTLFYYNHET
eukprot:560824_1